LFQNYIKLLTSDKFPQKKTLNPSLLVSGQERPMNIIGKIPYAF